MNHINSKDKILIFILGMLIFTSVIMGGYCVYVDNKIKEKITIIKSLSNNNRYIIPPTQKQIVDLKTSIVFRDQEITDTQPILTVGKEDLFFKDYNIEVQNISKGKEINEIIIVQTLEKLINDSTIIQYSIDKGYIQIPSLNIYNSFSKNHAQRLDLILQCEEMISKNEFRKISGQGLKIVFSNIESKNISLNEGKEIIRKNVINLYADFKAGKISPYNFTLSPTTAGFEKMPNLTIDSSSFDFDTSANKKISESNEFDSLLWQTPILSITPIFHESDLNDEEIYLFGFIKKKIEVGYESISDFYKKNANLYEVIVY